MCMTPCMVRLAISAAHSSSSRYSEVKGSASKSGPDGASRRSTGNRSRSVGTLEPRPASGPSQPSSSPIFHRSAQSVRAAPGKLCDGSAETNCCTSRGKSSGPPGVGSAHTSSSRKSRVSSWIRQGREVCAVLGSLIRGPQSIRVVSPGGGLLTPLAWAWCHPPPPLSSSCREHGGDGEACCGDANEDRGTVEKESETDGEVRGGDGDRDRSDGGDLLDQLEVVGGDHQAEQPEGEGAEAVGDVDAEPNPPHRRCRAVAAGEHAPEPDTGAFYRRFDRAIDRREVRRAG